MSQHLIPGDRLMGVDGEAAVVQFVLMGNNFTSIQSIEMADEVPNAYAWKANRQQYLVVSGGLVRLKGFFLDGMAFVIASMLAALRQPGCVCEWDFQATRDILRSLWPDFMLPDIMRDGMAQIEHLFSFINDKEAGKDPCLQPSLACRLKSYASGFNFTELPDCAGLYPQFLTVTTAYINIDNTVLYMGFNDTLDQSAAENPRNYALSPEVEISAVSLDEQNQKAVRLTLKDVKPGCAFALSLGALMSSHGRPLAADQRQHVVNSHQPSTGS